MSTTTDATPVFQAPAPGAAEAPDSESVEGATPETGADKDWRAEYEAQRKINRDLEAKVRREASPLKSRIAELEAENAKLSGREGEHAADQERRATEAQALAKANERIVRAEIRAAAAGKLADPADALRYLDPSTFEVGDDGDTDTAAIAAAVDDLISRKPYLAAQGRRFQGGGDGGARKETAPNLDDQIAAAEKARNHVLAISLKRQKARNQTN